MFSMTSALGTRCLAFVTQGAANRQWHSPLCSCPLWSGWCSTDPRSDRDVPGLIRTRHFPLASLGWWLLCGPQWGRAAEWSQSNQSQCEWLQPDNCCNIYKCVKVLWYGLWTDIYPNPLWCSPAQFRRLYYTGTHSIIVSRGFLWHFAQFNHQNII